MSSGTSTSSARSERAGESLEPWQFFVLASLVCATAATVIARGQSAVAVILLSVLMATVCLVGLAVLRALRPLIAPDEERTAMVGHRTRAALEREKLMTLRAIKELEFDRAMGKLSEADWQEMSGRLRARATGLIRQLDAGAGYREQIERDLAKRLAQIQAPSGPQASAHVPPDLQDAAHAQPSDPADAQPATGSFCTQCGTKNDVDAKFCKNCGHKV